LPKGGKTSADRAQEQAADDEQGRHQQRGGQRIAQLGERRGPSGAHHASSNMPLAAGKFYAEVFGWRDDDRPLGVYHRMVPGGQFKNPDGSDSEI